jgi:DNA-directed RNA polymerase subunit E'/Rpb7
VRRSLGTYVRRIDKPKEEYKKTVRNIYSRTLITKSVTMEMKYVGANIKDVLELRIRELYEGKCSNEGFIKPKSSRIISYSSGIIKGYNILFEILFECQACFPVEGQLVHCVAKNITKAGIRGESSNEIPTPFVVFVARDHQISNPVFSEIKENDAFVARVIGQRFELNDEYISIIAEIADKSKYK